MISYPMSLPSAKSTVATKRASECERSHQRPRVTLGPTHPALGSISCGSRRVNWARGSALIRLLVSAKTAPTRPPSARFPPRQFLAA